MKMKKEHIVRNSNKQLVIVQEYNDKYVLNIEIEGEMHGGNSISKITFEDNSRFSDLIDYLEKVLVFKGSELECLYD